ncbi:MAG: c-type cytochrome [Pirellulales bacterium]
MRCFLCGVVQLAAVAASVAVAQELPGELSLLPGFELELVYRVPAEQGSWVALTANDRGGLVASAQTGGLYQVVPSPIGQPAEETQTERIDTPLGMAQGLAVVGDSLYVMVNAKDGEIVSGLYRLRDTDNDGRWDDHELLRRIDASGEHGPHAIVPAADGNSLFVACGNMTPQTAFSRSALSAVAEDSPLARLPGPNPYAIGVAAPGGWIARVDLEGKNWELFSAGYRNQYDLAVNCEGELFTYDSDMEYDIGTPWYRPTRVQHVTSGSDFGWRSGSGKWPAHFADTLPAVADIGPGSPTGLEFGYETKFPKRYREALYAADWGRGVIQAVHLEPSGASYTSMWEPLLRATPLAVTDLAVNPGDGALYFATGGRGIESSLYRVVYRGNDDSVAAAVDSDEHRKTRELRRRLETYHCQAAGLPAVEFAWRELAHPDRFIRYAARTAIEHQPVELWSERAIEESNPAIRVHAALALARCGNQADAHAAANALTALQWDDLALDDRLALLRAYQIVVARHAPLPSELAGSIASQLIPHFPADDPLVTRDLVTVLSRIAPQRAIPLILEQFDAAWTDVDRIHFAHALCDLTIGWQSQQWQEYFHELAALTARHHDHSHRATLDQIAERAIEAAPAAERGELVAILADADPLDTAATPTKPKVREWSANEVVTLLTTSERKPDITRGRRLFAEARCADCHSIEGRGGAVGPVLTTAASRLSIEDLVRAVVEPDKVISDQYRQTVFQVGGRTLVGRVIDHHKGRLRIATDMTDPKRSEFVPVSEIERQTPSPVSPMPRGLLDVLTAEEIVDLFGYLRESR